MRFEEDTEDTFELFKEHILQIADVMTDRLGLKEIYANLYKQGLPDNAWKAAHRIAFNVTSGQ